MSIVVVVHRASGLPSTDRTTAIDPYVLVRAGDQVMRTDVERSAGSEPEFNGQKFVFEWYYGISLVCFTLKDQDSFSSDDHVCEGELPILTATQRDEDQESTFEVSLFRGKNKKNAGMLYVSVLVNVPKEVIEQSLRWVKATSTLTLKRAEGLFNTDTIGKLDPYVKVEVDATCYRSEKYIDAGLNPDFGNKEIEWKDSKESVVTLTVMDYDTLTRDDFVGDCVFNFLGKPPEGEIELPLKRGSNSPAGKVFVGLHVDRGDEECLAGDRLPCFFCVPSLIHCNMRAGVLHRLVEGGSREGFRTYEMRLRDVPEVFHNVENKNYDDSHKKIFEQNATGASIRTVIRAEHFLLYRHGMKVNRLRKEGRRTTCSWIYSFNGFLSWIRFGTRSGIRRVYTYALIDDGLFFSETGARMSKDVMSKHAVHANASPAVRMAGTFRVCFDAANMKSVLVVDNDSGTYRPTPEGFSRFEEVFRRNFVGANLLMLDVCAGQPPETKALVGPSETTDTGTPIYKGKWVWRQESGSLRSCHSSSGQYLKASGS